MQQQKLYYVVVTRNKNVSIFVEFATTKQANKRLVWIYENWSHTKMYELIKEVNVVMFQHRFILKESLG